MDHDASYMEGALTGQQHVSQRRPTRVPNLPPPQSLYAPDTTLRQFNSPYTQAQPQYTYPNTWQGQQMFLQPSHMPHPSLQAQLPQQQPWHPSFGAPLPFASNHPFFPAFPDATDQQHSKTNFLTESQIAQLIGYGAWDYLESLGADLEQGGPAQPQYGMSSTQLGLLPSGQFQNTIPSSYNQAIYNAQRQPAITRTPMPVAPRQPMQSVAEDSDLEFIGSRKIPSAPLPQSMYGQIGRVNIDRTPHLQRGSSQKRSILTQLPTFLAQRSHQARPKMGPPVPATLSPGFINTPNATDISSMEAQIPHSSSMQVPLKHPSRNPMVHEQHVPASPKPQHGPEQIQAQARLHYGAAKHARPTGEAKSAGGLDNSLPSKKVPACTPTPSRLQTEKAHGNASRHAENPVSPSISTRQPTENGSRPSLHPGRGNKIHLADDHERLSMQPTQGQNKRALDESTEPTSPIKRPRTEYALFKDVRSKNAPSKNISRDVLLKNLTAKDVPLNPELKKGQPSMPQPQQQHEHATNRPSLQRELKDSETILTPPADDAHTARLYQSSTVVPTASQPSGSSKRDSPSSPDEDPVAKRPKVDGALVNAQLPQQEPEQIQEPSSQQIPSKQQEKFGIHPEVSNKRDRSMSPEQDAVAKKAKSNHTTPPKPQVQQKRPKKVVKGAIRQPSSKKSTKYIPAVTKNPSVLSKNLTHSQEQSQRQILIPADPPQSRLRSHTAGLKTTAEKRVRFQLEEGVIPDDVAQEASRQFPLQPLNNFRHTSSQGDNPDINQPPLKIIEPEEGLRHDTTQGSQNLTDEANGTEEHETPLAEDDSVLIGLSAWARYAQVRERERLENEGPANFDLAVARGDFFSPTSATPMYARILRAKQAQDCDPSYIPPLEISDTEDELDPVVEPYDKQQPDMVYTEIYTDTLYAESEAANWERPVFKSWDLGPERGYSEQQRKVNAILDYTSSDCYLRFETRKKETARKQQELIYARDKELREKREAEKAATKASARAATQEATRAATQAATQTAARAATQASARADRAARRNW
jgi:hypothetical protein